MRLDFKDVKDDVKNYLSTGGVYEFEIDKVYSGVSPTGTDFLAMDMHVIDTGETHTERFYMTGNAVQYSLKKIKHIGTKFTTEDRIDDCTSAEDLNELFKGRKFRSLVRSEEYIKTNGDVGIRVNFGLPKFAEAIEEGGEYSPISANESRLRFNPAKDHKSLTPAPEGEDSGAPSSGGLYS